MKSILSQSSPPIERLETRRLLSVGQDINGFTFVTPSADSQQVFVSTSGSDQNNGLSADHPVKSFTRGMSLLRDGYPDQLLLKRGDTFSNDSLSNWWKSGRSSDEPLVISSYGVGPRPVIHPDGQMYGFYSSVSSPVRYIDLLGVQFIYDQRDPTSPRYLPNAVGGHCGFEFYSPGGNLLVEDCTFQFWRGNLDIEGVNNGFIQNVTIRRCVITDAYNASSGRAQGIYGYNLTGLSLIENVFDHNGWNDAGGVHQNGYSHDIYLSSTTTDVALTGNIIAESSDVGALLRGGARVRNNLFLQNPVGLSMGNANGANSTVGGISGEISGNAIIGDAAIGNLTVGEGMEFGNIKPGGFLVQNNILTQDTQQAKDAILVSVASGTYNSGVCVGENDITIRNNIVYGWRRGLHLDASLRPGAVGLWALNNLSVYNNDFQQTTLQALKHESIYDNVNEHWANNRYSSTLAPNTWLWYQNASYSGAQWQALAEPTASSIRVPYADPNRSAATYNATQGGAATLVAFLAQARRQSSDYWRIAYTAQPVIDYVRAGFSIDTTPPSASVSGPAIGPTTSPTTPYTFTVTFQDNFAVDPSTIASTNVSLVFANGLTLSATLVSIDGTIAGAVRVATYQITPPAIGWTADMNGIATVSIAAPAVRDTSGNAMPTGAIGTLTVSFGTGPSAICNAGDVGAYAQGFGSYAFNITYTDPAGVDPASLVASDVIVTAPDGTIVPVQLLAVDANTVATALIATYSFSPPSGNWDSRADGVWSINLAAGAASDAVGNPSAAQSLVQFTADLTPPTASATAPDILGDFSIPDAQTITVIYTDKNAFDSSSVGPGNINLTAPNGATISASLISVGLVPPSQRPVNFQGDMWMATYQVAAPAVGWTAADNGIYSINLVGGQVRDAMHNYTPAAMIGSFTVQVFTPVPYPSRPAKNKLSSASDKKAVAKPQPVVLTQRFIVRPGGVPTVLQNAKKNSK